MDRVTFGDGLSYEKASIIAKRFKYTSDYVGQLCRARKIDARLVGRTWYVNPDSMEKYQSQKKRTAEKVLKNSAEFIPSRLDVVSVVGKNTSRSLRFTAHQNTASVSSLYYNADENDLYPRLSRTIEGKPGQAIEVDLAGAKQLRIHHSKKVTYFKSSELPLVSLSGSVPVKDASLTLPSVPSDVDESSPRTIPVSVLPETKTGGLQPAQLTTVVSDTSSMHSVHTSRYRRSKVEPSLVTALPVRFLPARSALLLAGVVTFFLVGATLFISTEYFTSVDVVQSSVTFDTTQFAALLSLISYTH